MRIFRRDASRPISEAVAYARCHGERSHDIVRVTKVEPRRPRYQLDVSGEMLRRAFETRLAHRGGSSDRS